MLSFSPKRSEREARSSALFSRGPSCTHGQRAKLEKKVRERERKYLHFLLFPFFLHTRKGGESRKCFVNIPLRAFGGGGDHRKGGGKAFLASSSSFYFWPLYMGREGRRDLGGRGCGIGGGRPCRLLVCLGLRSVGCGLAWIAGPRKRFSCSQS